MKLLTAIWQVLFGSPGATIDHAPIEQPPYRYPKLRAKALARHGRAFRCDEKVKRETPASHDLQEIEARAPKVAGNVSSLKRRNGT